APFQAVILPIADRHNGYAQSLDKIFKENGLRSQLDLRREKIGHKIRDAETQKIPFILIVGDKEVKNGTASLRVHTVGDKGEVNVNEFLEKVKELDKNKSLTMKI
ncbi:MAG: His/Gly/Thr/Pro-type tRNA ligase C-terminal domain-containing protein, partial [Candidatus Aminicenantes bacterium]|nr:His/Gly/Thr/Pro-type tRNA ligase C-terminal domain-containing protein [Candidatus Aminicenantes bacterium]